MSRPTIYRKLLPGVSELTLNRPQKSNALNAELIRCLLDELSLIEKDKALRVLVISGQGKNFCAGADLSWVLNASQLSMQQNQAETLDLADLLYRLKSLPMVTVAKVQGAAIGGGIGLLACCDLVISANDSRFAFTESRLGLSPVTIMPYVKMVMASRPLQWAVLTAQAFSARKARKWGLVSYIADAQQLDEQLKQLIENMLQAEPSALRHCKRVLLQGTLPDRTVVEDSARQLAALRISEPVRDRLQALLQSTRPKA